MKSFLLVTSILYTIIIVETLTPDQTAKLNKISKICQAESGVTQEVVVKARNGEFEEDPKLKKQMLCVAKNVGLVNDSGEIVTDALKNKVKKVAANDEEVEKVVNKCVVKKDTPEDTVFHFVKCVMESHPNFSPVD